MSESLLHPEDQAALDQVLIQHLRAQLAAAKTDAKNFGEQMCATNDRLIAAQDQLAAARKALEPFVKHYESWMERLEDHEQLHVYPRHTMGDLRAALRSLDGAGK